MSIMCYKYEINILLYTCTTEGPGITHVSTRNGVEVQDNMHIYTRKCSVNHSWFKFCIQPLSIEQILVYYDANVHEVSIYVLYHAYYESYDLIGQCEVLYFTY